MKIGFEGQPFPYCLIISFLLNYDFDIQTYNNILRNATIYITV